MIEQVTDRPNQYQVLQAEAYPRYAKVMEDILIKEYREPFTFGLGNNYRIAFSSGEDLLIKSMFRYPQRKTGESIPFDQLFLFAFNSQGQLIGHRRTWEHYDGGSYIVLNGGIALRERGRGYAMPIELVHKHILQQQATTTNTRIIYEVTNDNKKNLDEKKEEKLASTDLIYDLEKEQTRWQDMYSPSGKLGVNEEGIIHFNPQSISLNPQLQERLEIRLKRRDKIESGRIRAVAEITDYIIISRSNKEDRNKQDIIDELQKVA